MRDINDRLEEMAEGDTIQELFFLLTVLVEEDIGRQEEQFAQADVQTNLNDAQPGGLRFAGRVDADHISDTLNLPMDSSTLEVEEVVEAKDVLEDAVRRAGYTPESTAVQAESKRRTF